MDNHILFIGNVASHLVALMSGIASFCIALWQAYKKHPLPERIFWFVGIICLLVAFDSAWQDEHRNARVVISEKASEVGLKTSCLADKRIDALTNQFLQLQLNSQSGTLSKTQADLTGQQQNLNKAQSLTNSCLIILGKKSAPPPLQLRLHLVEAEEKAPIRGVERETVIIADTNRILVTTRLLLECNKPFEVLNSGTLTDRSMTLHAPQGNPRPTPFSLVINVVSPSFTPDNRLIAVLKYVPDKDGDFMGCGITQQ